MNYNTLHNTAPSLISPDSQHASVISLDGAKDASQLPLGPLSVRVSHLRHEGVKIKVLKPSYHISLSTC